MIHDVDHYFSETKQLAGPGPGPIIDKEKKVTLPLCAGITQG